MNQKYHIHLFPNKRITQKLYHKEPFKELSYMKNIFFVMKNSREEFPGENKRDIFVIKTLNSTTHKITEQERRTIKIRKRNLL